MKLAYTQKMKQPIPLSKKVRHHSSIPDTKYLLKPVSFEMFLHCLMLQH